MDEDDAAFLLSQAQKYREVGQAMHDRQTRLALLELAFEYEERAQRLLEKLGSQAAASRPQPGQTGPGTSS